MLFIKESRMDGLQSWAKKFRFLLVDRQVTMMSHQGADR